MSYVFIVILLVVLFGSRFVPAITVTVSQTTSSTNTTPTTPTTKDWRFYFEGVDWTLHPPHVYATRHDCPANYIRCIRRTTPLLTVCGFNIYTNFYEDYYSVCEIELENCETRVRNWGKVYGDSHKDDVIFHNGETLDCHYYYRRSSGPEEMDNLYFGGRKSQRLSEFLYAMREDEYKYI